MQFRKYIPQLTYALNGDNQLVHIDSVNNGKECNCFCPCCRNPLVARNNSIHIQHHFAHADEVDCGKAFESALHLLAKQIFEKEKSLMLPRYKTVKARVQFFDGVETEQRVDALDVQPDSVGISNGHRILVEFKNTHAIDDTKKQKIADLKLACVEIDISEQELDEDAFTKFLLSSTEKRIWINAPQLEEEHIANRIKAKEAFRNKQMFLAFVVTLGMLFIPGIYPSAVTLGVILVASSFYPTKERIHKITGSDNFLYMMTNPDIVKEKILPQDSDCMEKKNNVDVASKPQTNSKTESHTTTNN